MPNFDPDYKPNASYTITITYKEPVNPVQNNISPISPVFDFGKPSYINSSAYKDEQSNKIWDTKVINNNNDVTSLRNAGATSTRSIYDTSAESWGGEYDPEIYAHTFVDSPVPLARFYERAAKNAITGQTYTVTFVTSDRSEVAYYEALGKALQGQDFEVSISTEVEFKRYCTPDSNDASFATDGITMYIPKNNELVYFNDIADSDTASPATIDGVTIDYQLGNVYTATELDSGIYIVKTDKIVIIYNSTLGTSGTTISFTHNGIDFANSSDALIDISTLNIIGKDSNGDWTCASDSIIITSTSGNYQCFIGKDVTSPTV